MVVSAQARIRLRGIHLTRMPKRARTWLEITGFGTNLGDMGAVDRGAGRCRSRCGAFFFHATFILLR
jgi:hypothetical protein